MSIPHVAIVGYTNVGKSTLFNRLVGRRRSIVSDEPGLTRDLIEATAHVGGGPITLVDTGGLLAPGESPLADAIRDRVLAAARGCDLLIFLVDALRGLTPMDEELARLLRQAGRPILLAINKVDAHEGAVSVAEFVPLGFDEAVPISATHGWGIAELHMAMEKRLPAPGEEARDLPEIRIAIAGRPNVGKSSLLNALLGEDRALVSESPGTTRDPVDSLLTRRGRRYRFIDTAGIRRRGRVERGPEALSVDAARRSVAGSDVTLVLFDTAEGLVAQDQHVLGLVAGGEGSRVRPAVVLLNKADLVASREVIRQRVEQIKNRLRFASFAPVIAISALRRWHLDRIFAAVDAVYEESTRFLATAALNDWLRRAASAHQPALAGGKPLSFVFVTQASAQPPTFTILTNRPLRPHFSYARYLENSLRERFHLRLTPVVLRFRARQRGRGALH